MSLNAVVAIASLVAALAFAASYTIAARAAILLPPGPTRTGAIVYAVLFLAGTFVLILYSCLLLIKAVRPSFAPKINISID